jgi:hypothetical protein
VIQWFDGSCGNFACREVARAYDASGTPVTGEIVVSPTTNGLYERAQVAIDNSGTFVVVFHRYLWNPSSPPQSEHIYWRRFSSSGTSLGTTTFVDYGHSPDISMASNGDFYVSYSTPALSGQPDIVYVKRYAANGTLLGPRITVANTVPPGVSTSEIRLQCDADFLVSWGSTGGTTSGQRLQRYFANGTPNGPPLQPGGRATTPHESAMYRSNGSIGIVYVGAGNTQYLGRFDPSGNPAAPELLQTTGSNAAQISSNKCGEYAVITQALSGTIEHHWYSYSDVFRGTNAVNSSPATTNYRFGIADMVSVDAWTRDLAPPTPTLVQRDVIHRRLPVWPAFDGLAGPDRSACAYPNYSVSVVIGSPPVPGYSYSWSPTTYLNNPNAAQPTVTYPGGSAGFSTTYVLTVTGECGCQMTDEVVVSFHPGACSRPRDPR